MLRIRGGADVWGRIGGMDRMRHSATLPGVALTYANG